MDEEMELAELKLNELKLEKERLQKEVRDLEERRKSLSPKERLYDHIQVSVRTMDIFIGCMLALLVVVVVMGLLRR